MRSAIAGTPAAELVRDILIEHRALTERAFATYLEAPQARAELYEVACDYPRRGGRGLRASICIASTRAFGGDARDAVSSAISLELLHNAFLIHDDVEDDSDERRGQPTLHKLHGVPAAINAGDALAIMSLRPLLENRARLGPRIALRVLEEAEWMARESVEGQALELAWRADNALDLDEADYLRMILKKTCWYTTIYPLRVGALIGTRDGVQLANLLRFGFFLGAAFQIQDDLLNIVGDPDRYGKEIGGDVFEGKRTLLLIRLLHEARDAERAKIASILAGARSRRTPEQVAFIIERMHHHACIEYAREIAHGLAGAAMHEFETAYAGLPETREKQFLRCLPSWVLERT